MKIWQPYFEPVRPGFSPVVPASAVSLFEKLIQKGELQEFRIGLDSIDYNILVSSG
jgi:hypothetical protein